MEKMYTLARGGRARKFGYEEKPTEVVFHTGKDFSSSYSFTNNDLNGIVEYFKDKGWFILGNQVDNVKPDGMGAYFESIFGLSLVKLASHAAAYLVKQGKLLYRDDYGYLEFKVR
ncbi:MAG: hypothetical protein FWE62_04370 [Firmicutes bacterium]|nr:hypothetical protein [Bacillota bacterium]